MSILGAAYISAVRPDSANPGMLVLDFTISGLVSGNLYGPANSNISNVDPITPSPDIGSQVEQAAQSILVGQGYSFGTGDYVRLIGVV